MAKPRIRLLLRLVSRFTMFIPDSGLVVPVLPWMSFVWAGFNYSTKARNLHSTSHAPHLVDQQVCTYH
eukprot:9401036-Karenia_brevis.AAC.1